MSNELCKCGKVGKISCPNDERCGTMTNNTKLPATFQKELDDLIMKHTLELPNNNDHQAGYEKGMENGIEIGATEYATKLYEAQQENERPRSDFYETKLESCNLRTAYDNIARQYQQLKARCEKMEAALDKISNNAPNPKLIAALALEEESNTPAPREEIEYMPILTAELSELKKVPNVPVCVPMNLLNEQQAYSNHGQSLQRLKEHGGLSVRESLSLITRQHWRYYSYLDNVKAVIMLNEFITNNNPH